MTQSGKHFLTEFRGTCSKFVQTTPNGLSIILVKFEDHRSDAAPEMTYAGKHGTLRGVFLKFLSFIP